MVTGKHHIETTTLDDATVSVSIFYVQSIYKFMTVAEINELLFVVHISIRTVSQVESSQMKLLWIAFFNYLSAAFLIILFILIVTP